MKYETIVQEWVDKRNEVFEDFLKSLKNETYREYRFPDNPNFPSYESLDDDCKLCIFEQIKKYKDRINDELGGQIGNNFLINCGGIPREYIKDDVFDYLGITSEERKDQLRASRDPVVWARLNAFTEKGEPWIARRHQEVMLRCTSNRAVFRSGRRIGKSDALMIKMIFECIVLRDRPDIIKDGVKKKQPLTVLFIAPRQSHADNLWKKFEAQIQHSPVIRESISKYRRYPYVDIEFKNGSRIYMLTAGTGGANAGLSIRSFSADYLCLDEGNYLGEEELKAALAILMTNETCKMVVSSTPVGVQDFFYDWCFNSEGFKEFHYPTPVLEHWDKVKKSVYQDTQSLDDFLHEFMAEFSPPGHAVFRMDLIRKAIRPYKYISMERDASMVYSIGVDWNSAAGTEIVVLGYNREQNNYIVVDNINVPKSMWTQLSSCEAIIDAVKKWKPSALVADEGYGSVQIEILRMSAFKSQDPDIQDISEILIPYNFSSKIEVFDPITKKPVKKSAKPFLVKNAVSRFEEENIIISSEDTLLIEQLSQYQIKSVSNLGQPTYWVPRDDIGDHRLDALMLSIMGFKMKQSVLFDNGGSVADIDYIPPSSDKFSDEEKKIVRESGFKELFTSRRNGSMIPKLRKIIGRKNVY